MKKIMSRRSIAVCLFLFIMTFCLISLSAPAYSADKAIARLTSFSGTVLIKSQGSWGVQPEKDLPLYSDDKIVTKVGIATVTFDDGAVMEIKANSNLLVKETEQTGVARGVGAVKRQVRLLLGKMFFRSGRDTSVNTTLETTTMVCGLRGTAGVLSIDAAGITYLQFTEGGGDTIGNFIAGVAPDVPVELADLNPVQRAAFVAAAAADQAKQAASRLAAGEITDAEAALAAAQAAEAAAEEAKAAAEAMLDNPDPAIREEAAAVIEAAEAAIEEAREAQKNAIEAGAEGTITTEEVEGVEELGFDVSLVEATQGNEFDILNVLPEEIQGNSIGSFNAPILDATIGQIQGGDYYYTGSDYYSSYHFYYADDGSWGYSFYYYSDESGYYNEVWTYYYPDGTTHTYTYDSETGETEGEGTWDRNTFDVSTLSSPPEEYGADYEYSEYYEDEAVYMGYTGLGLTGDLSVGESMWGSEAQTGGVNLVAKGEINTYQSDASIWYDDIYSSNTLNATNTTYDGGAYYGYFGGIKNNDILEAGLLALGVAPDGTVGLLSAGDYQDPIYGVIAGDNTFEMEGPLTWQPKGTISGVTAASLMDNIHTSDGGFTRFAGTFGKSADIGYGYYDYWLYSDNFGTANIATSDESAAWGIFGGYDYGFYDTRTNATSWSGHIGAYAGFGIFYNEAYFNEFGEYPEDFGYYIGTASGTQADGRIAGGVDGSFITYTKMGDVDGNILGTYDLSTGLWSSVSLGTWEGVPLSHASVLDTTIDYETTYYYGQYDYSGGGYFYYDYYEDNTWGYSSHHPTSSYYPYTYTYYYEDGTIEISEYDAEGNYLGTTYGTWDPETQDLADVVPVPTPPNSETAVFDYEYSYIETNYYSMEALWGGTESLWAGSAPVKFLGGYGEYVLNNNSGVFTDTVYSYDYINDTYMTYDGGAYRGFIGGVALENGTIIDDLEARLITLYIDPYGNAGILKGTVTGYGYEDLGGFEMDGTVNPVEMENAFAIDPADLYSNTLVRDTYLIEGGYGDFPEGYIDFEQMDATEYSIQGADWGISILEGKGTYEGVASDTWSSSLNSYDELSEREEWREITGTQWSDGKTAADMAGAWINIADAQTGVSGAELMGTFDPNNLYWRSFATEAWIETSKFLDMAATEEGRSKLAQLDIPCVQVGVTDFSYTDETMEASLASVTMNDVEFFAYSTGAAPKIWATGDVQGVTRDNPQYSMPTLTNTDSSVSVYFYMLNYDNTDGGTWNAYVDGSGTVSGHAITMQGGAAGTVDSTYTVGYTEGAFSGTAAGVAQEQQ